MFIIAQFDIALIPLSIENRKGDPTFLILIYPHRARSPVHGGHVFGDEAINSLFVFQSSVRNCGEGSRTTDRLLYESLLPGGIQVGDGAHAENRVLGTGTDCASNFEEHC
jgi:hypothetical protein